jgi:hypothetical protein
MPYDFDAIIAIAEGSRSVAGSSRNTIHHYSTPDTHAVVFAANYFNPAAPWLQIGDVIIASTGIGGTPVLRMYMVTNIAAGVVTIAQLSTA